MRKKRKTGLDFTGFCQRDTCHILLHSVQLRSHRRADDAGDCAECGQHASSTAPRKHGRYLQSNCQHNMQKIEDGVHRIPTPSTTDGMPSPSAAIAAVGVIITAGTAAPAATSRGVVPRSCAAGAGPLTKARQRRATHAARATQAVISLEERAMIERVAWRGGVLASVSCEPNPEGHSRSSPVVTCFTVYSSSACVAAECFLSSEAGVNRCTPELGKSPTHLILHGFALSRLAVQGMQHAHTHTTCRHDGFACSPFL